MTNVSEWSVTAGLNTSSPPNGWPEGMARSAVNDCAREMMAALSKWYQDSRAALITAGGPVNYTLTTNSVHTALTDIPMLAFRVNIANTGSANLNVDGLGSKPLRKTGSTNFSAGEMTLGQTMVVVYNSATDSFETVGPAPVPPSSFATGTAMLFAQTAAPSGWTKDLTHNNKALRLVTGTASSGGTTPFTTILGSRTLTQANLPSVNLSTASITGSVNTALNNGTGVARNISLNSQNYDQPGGANAVEDVNFTSSTLSLVSGTVTFGGTIPLGGTGTAMDFAVQYVDVILATKA